MKKKLWVSGLVVLGGLIAGIVFLEKAHFSSHESKPIQFQDPWVRVANPIHLTLPETVTALGEIKAEQYADLKAQQSGSLTKVWVKSGEVVQANQTLFQLNDRIQKANAQSAEAAFIQAKEHFDRVNELLKSGAASEDERDAQLKVLKQAQAQYNAANQALSETVIQAPFAGRVTQTDLTVGSYVNVGDVLIGIVGNQGFYVQYVLPAHDFQSVRLGQPIMFKNPSTGEKIDGAVSYISPEVDPQNASFSVQAHLEGDSQSVTAGNMVSVKQTLKMGEKILAIPAIAVSGDPNGFYVFALVSPAKAGSPAQILMKRITIGQNSGNWVSVTSGLTEKDWVVVEGQEKVHDGQKVQVKTESLSDEVAS